MKEGKIRSILPQLCAEIKEMKVSYFSRIGKPHANWNPLKPKTIKYKKDYNTSFNIETGYLRDSINVEADIIDGEIYIYCTANHKNGDEAIDKLIYKYGRNFLDFSEDEAEIIVNRIHDMLNGYTSSNELNGFGS